MTRKDRRPDRVARVQDQSLTMYAAEPWLVMLKAGAVAAKEMAVLAYYFALGHLLPALVVIALLMGGFLLLA